MSWKQQKKSAAGALPKLIRELPSAPNVEGINGF
jgi:hypothetical protein